MLIKYLKAEIHYAFSWIRFVDFDKFDSVHTKIGWYDDSFDKSKTQFQKLGSFIQLFSIVFFNPYCVYATERNLIYNKNL